MKLEDFCAKGKYMFFAALVLMAAFVISSRGGNMTTQKEDVFFHGPHMTMELNQETMQASFMGEQESLLQEEALEKSGFLSVAVAEGNITTEVPNVEPAKKVEPAKGSVTENTDTKPAKQAQIPPARKTEIKQADVEAAKTTATPTTTIASNPNMPVLGNLGIAAGGGLIYMNQEDLDKYFTDLKSLGARWVRWDLDWRVVQPSRPDDYDWSAPDRVISTANRYGIKSLAVITYAPKWAKAKDCQSGKNCPPEDASMYARFAGEAAGRYKGKNDFWEIWNEPNYAIFWYPKADASKYAELLKAAHIRIKQANPQATVISGGLVMAESNGQNVSPKEFINYLYDSGFRNYFDAVAIHPYSYPLAPSYNINWNGWKQMEGIRKIMTDREDGGKKIWITEFGAPTGGPGTECELNKLKFTYNNDYMSEEAQKKMAEDAAAMYVKEKQWLGPFFWYNLRDNGQDKSSAENFFGLIRYDGSKKPAYDVLKEKF